MERKREKAIATTKEKSSCLIKELTGMGCLGVERGGDGAEALDKGRIIHWSGRC